MKRAHVYRIFFIALTLVFAQEAYGAPGCMEKGWNRYSESDEEIFARPDHKELRYVACSCPCLQYSQHEWYGECSRCHHYRRPIEYT